jgi:hypothetical protein
MKGHVVTTVSILRGRLAEPWTLSPLAGERSPAIPWKCGNFPLADSCIWSFF